jgi:cardiolipin synthase
VPATTSDDGAGLGRVVTIPNAITALRLASVPVFEWLLFGAHRQTAAAILLGLLGATDWVDGFLARRLHQVSTVGKVLDPTADRVLVGAAVVSVIVAGAVPLWFGIATLVREALVSLAVVTLAALGAERIDVTWLGKAGTFGLMFAYPTFLLAHGHAGWQSPFEVIAWVCAIPGLTLAWLAAAAYVPAARRALGRGRAGRARRGKLTGNQGSPGDGGGEGGEEGAAPGSGARPAPGRGGPGTNQIAAG